MTATTNTKSDTYQRITDTIITMLENGVAPWRKPWSTAHNGMARNLVSGKEYRGINYFLLNAMTRYESPYWLTFKQASERGGHVRKGEKGMPVIFWKLYEKENEATGEETVVPVLRQYTVFNSEQCNGLEVPIIEQPETHENERIARAEAIQLAMPNRPSVTFGGSRAYYSPSQDVVNVPNLERFENSNAYYATLFHELAHSTGHAQRLNRAGVMDHATFGSCEYSKEELCAEMTSAFLCAKCGIDNSTLENSAAYIASWLKALKNDSKMVVLAAAQAQKAADYILNVQSA